MKQINKLNVRRIDFIQTDDNQILPCHDVMYYGISNEDDTQEFDIIITNNGQVKIGDVDCELSFIKESLPKLKDYLISEYKKHLELIY
jgi:hypothetical protein